MGTTTCLQDSIKHTHDELAEQFVTARTVMPERGHSRRGCQCVDLYLVGSSRHLHAVDEVLLPAVEQQGDHGRSLAHDYQLAAHELAVVLTHVKAHEYGSPYEHGFAWSDVWNDVQDAMAGQRQQEEALGDELSLALEDGRLEMLTSRLETVAGHEPTRPHPYLPHHGAAGRMARWLARASDGFWDTVESRYLPDRPSARNRRRGLFTEYLLAQTHFEDEEELEP